jgi:calcium/calmodulin-dependent protein kinase (CaM kinase) II
MESFTTGKNSLHDELLAISQRLLESILVGDWETYAALCDPSITAFEPEARGQLVQGLDFHGFYFDQGGVGGPHNTTMASPHVRLLGSDVAVVCYVRLTQRMDAEGRASTSRCEETRVWHRTAAGWKHVHFHRSLNE